MRHYSAEETAALLPYPELANTIADTLLNADKTTVPARGVTDLGNGALLIVMPAVAADLAITKLVTVHPDNQHQGKPTIHSDVIVMNAKTGERLGLLEGATVTARRTAALSLLAVQTLAPKLQGPLLIVGAGVEARAHLEAFHVGLGVTEVVVASRTEARAQALADYATSLGMRARTASDPDDAAASCPLIVTATTSPKPVLQRPLSPGSMVCAIGAFQPEKAELSAEFVGHSHVVVDTEEGARSEAGDLIQAVEAGLWSWSGVLELRKVLRAPVKKLDSRPIVFKSVGHALFDLASGRLAFSGSREVATVTGSQPC